MRNEAASARACHLPESTERLTIRPVSGRPTRIHSSRRIFFSGPTIGTRRPSPASLFDSATMISSASQNTCGHCARPISLRRMPV